jgi:hypothetical protein
MRIQKLFSKSLVLALPLAVLAVSGAPSASAQDGPPPPPAPAPPADQPPPPPDAYVATVAPEYYEGHPVYLYNGNWYFRGPEGGWHYYHTEPAYLRDRRGHWNERARYHYNRR